MNTIQIGDRVKLRVNEKGSIINWSTSDFAEQDEYTDGSTRIGEDCKKYGALVINKRGDRYLCEWIDERGNKLRLSMKKEELTLIKTNKGFWA